MACRQSVRVGDCAQAPHVRTISFVVVDDKCYVTSRSLGKASGMYHVQAMELLPGECIGVTCDGARCGCLWGSAVGYVVYSDGLGLLVAISLACSAFALWKTHLRISSCRPLACVCHVPASGGAVARSLHCVRATSCACDASRAAV